MNPSTLSPVKTRISLSILVFLIAVLSATAGLEVLSEWSPLSRLDAEATSYYDGAFNGAIATYAVTPCSMRPFRPFRERNLPCHGPAWDCDSPWERSLIHSMI